jgi:predicted DCC family thiol-disulfide oxidoreductase YuxK
MQTVLMQIKAQTKAQFNAETSAQTSAVTQPEQGTQPDQSDRRVTMLFDGGCPLCAKEVAHYRRVDRENHVRWVDIDQDTRVLQSIGVSKEAAMKHLHVIDKAGKIVTGSYAFAAIWAELPRYRHLAKLVRLPGILPILDKAYNIFAEKRYNRRTRCNDSLCS